MEAFEDCARLSLNQITTERWSLREAVERCARHGIPAIGVWRHKIAEIGLRESVQLVRDAGLRVSSVCRGGMFPAATKEERAARIEENKRAIDEAAELRADTLVLVCGAAVDRDIEAARGMVRDGIAEIANYARERNVKLGVEPLHPMFAAERSCITSLSEANSLTAPFDADTVGVIIDVYHVWWDWRLADEINRAAGRICGFHVCDWLAPLAADPLMSRGMMGDGCIDIREIRRAVELAGYDKTENKIEVEIFNSKIWDAPGDDLLGLMKRRFLDCV